MRGPFILAALILASLHLSAGELPAPQLALELYDRGDYADCRGLVRRMIDDYAAGVIKVPAREMATIYLLAACLADVYREADYAEAVDDNLRIALEMDPNVDPAPVKSRTLVEDRFARLRAELVAAQGVTGRRFSFAAVVAMEGPGGLHWRSVPLFGIRFAAGILPWLSVEGGASLPVQASPIDEIELFFGGAFRPAFALNRPMLVLSASYVAAHRDAWTHGLSLGAGAEIALRAGVSFRLSAELLRVEAANSPDPDAGDFPSISAFGVPFTFSLPRLTLSAVYAF